MKQCTTCKITKALDEFNFKYKDRGIRQKQCKCCTRAAIRSHYRRNRAYYIKKSRKRNIKNKQKLRKFIHKYLLENPCIDCGERDPVVLEFDHVGEKLNNVSSFVGGNYGLETIKAEVAKCVVRCANCHRRKTAKEFDWYK